jgi:hypothetical protein
MDFSLSAEQEAIRAAVEKICARFGDDYWLAKDRDGGFPEISIAPSPMLAGSGSASPRNMADRVLA